MTEQKNIVEWIVNKVVSIFNIDTFKGKVDTFISKEYSKGLERSGVQFDMNFVSNDEDVDILKRYVFDNMESATDDLGNKLRGELQRGLLNKENVKQLKMRIKDTFKDKAYSNRLKAVIRTEKNRAGNMGALDGAKQSGLDLKKYLSVIVDSRTSNICLKEVKKYGSKEDAIGIDEEFVVKVDNKTYRGQTPPFHPNCRTVVRFVRVRK